MFWIGRIRKPRRVKNVSILLNVYYIMLCIYILYLPSTVTMKKTVIPHSLRKMNIFNSCIDPSPVIKYLDIINLCVYLISFYDDVNADSAII